MSGPHPMKDLESLAKKYKMNQVIVLCRRVGEDGYEHLSTYGTDKENCTVAYLAGEYLKKEVMKWTTKEGELDVASKHIKRVINSQKMLDALKYVKKRIRPDQHDINEIVDSAINSN